MIFGDDDDLPVGGVDDPNEDELDTPDDDPEEPEEPADPEPVEPLPTPPHKATANEVIRATKARARAAEQELAALKAAHQVRQQQPVYTPPPRDPAVVAAEERQRLENMPDVDRVQYIQRQVQTQTQIELQKIRMEMQIADDRRALRDELSANPDLARYEDAVEQEFQACLTRGQPRSRIELLNQAIGNEIRTKRQGAIGKARREAAKTVQRETTRPSTARSGVSASRGGATEDPGELLRRRLEGREYTEY